MRNREEVIKIFTDNQAKSNEITINILRILEDTHENGFVYINALLNVIALTLMEVNKEANLDLKDGVSLVNKLLIMKIEQLQGKQ